MLSACGGALPGACGVAVAERLLREGMRAVCVLDLLCELACALLALDELALGLLLRLVVPAYDMRVLKGLGPWDISRASMISRASTHQGRSSVPGFRGMMPASESRISHLGPSDLGLGSGDFGFGFRFRGVGVWVVVPALRVSCGST